MHSGHSIFTGVKTIDYRNGRYQGFFNSQTQKRRGMGILIDDDMNIYCSQWQDGRMNGLTFIYMNNGSYFYGLWRNNQPHGINIYRNKQFILIGAYHRGNNVGNTLAITDAINHVLVFNGQEIGSKDKKKDLELKSTENLLEISLFEDIIHHTAAKNQIKLNQNQLTLVNFLDYFSQKYSQHLQFLRKHGFYFFGFKTGLGFKFALHGKVNHKIALVTIGSHEVQMVTDFGVKFHDSRCIEEGNFVLKETITYNKFSERPRDKCIAIFQKNHKKALDFINEYFQFKSNFVLNIEYFLTSKLSPKHQQNMKYQFQQKRLQKYTSNLVIQPYTYQLKKEKSQIKRITPSKFDRNVSTQNIKMKKSGKDLSRNPSSFNLNKKPSKSTISPVKYQRKKYVYESKNQESFDYNQYKQIEDELNNYLKNEIVCQRCKSKQRKSQNKFSKTSNKKSLEKKPSNSKSTQKLNKQKSHKQIKFLINYKPPERQKGQIKQKIFQSAVKKEKNHQKSLSNNLKPLANYDIKQKNRIQNELKIRKQIYDKQMIRDAHIAQELNYPRTFGQFLGMNQGNRLQTIIDPLSFSPSSRQPRKYVECPKLSHYDFQYQNSPRNQLKNLDLYSKPPVIPLTSVSSIKKIQELSNRRDRILRQFKALNTTVVIQPQIQRQPIYCKPDYPATYGDQIMQNRLTQKDRISELNKKYRNYLHPEDVNKQQKNNQNEILHRQSYDAPKNQPYVASFTYSPVKKDIGTPQGLKIVDWLSRQYDNKPKKRYQYFFDH